MIMRVSPYMNKLTSPCQNAFIKGVNTIDGVMYLHKILHESRRKKQQEVVLKLNFEKAYDKVNPRFLFHSLEYGEFNEASMKWF